MTTKKTLPYGETKKIALIDPFGALQAHFPDSDDISMAPMSEMEALHRFAEQAEATIDDRFAEKSDNLLMPEILSSDEVTARSLDQFYSPWENDETGKWDIVDYDFKGVEEYDAQTMQIVSECKVRFLDDDDIECPPTALTDECRETNETEQAQPASLLLEERLLETNAPKLPRSLSVAPVKGGITQGPNSDDPHGSSPSGNYGGDDD
ncbi:hypothetical protein [Parasphingorhabdus sp. NYA22]